MTGPRRGSLHREIFLNLFLAWFAANGGKAHARKAGEALPTQEPLARGHVGNDEFLGKGFYVYWG
jgi:hypothetical protein